MGVLTDYFLADQKQLAEIFRGWLMADEQPTMREVTNPFTKKSQLIPTWNYTTPIADGPPNSSIELSAVPHLLFKRVDLVKIGTLIDELGDKKIIEAIEIPFKEALRHPTSNETGLHEIPSLLVKALKNLFDDEIEDLASKWHQTEEMQMDRFSLNDCTEVLQSLRSLASKMTGDQRMYLLWST